MAQIRQRDNGSWLARIRRTGWPEQSSSFDTRVAAEAWARKIEREMDTGAFLPSDSAKRFTFGKLAENYAAKVLPQKRSARNEGYALARLVEEFGRYSLTSITAADLSAYRDKRLKVVGPQTVVHELGLVSRLYEYAIKDQQIHVPLGNPIKQVRRPKLPPGRNRRLVGTEEQFLLDALRQCEHSSMAPAIEFALETAARQSEILSLQWEDVNLKACTVRLRGIDGRETKSGDPFRDVPLSPHAVEVLKGLPRPINGKGSVFGLTAPTIRQAWAHAVKRARRTYVYGLLRQHLSDAGITGEAQIAELRAVTYKKKKPAKRTLELLVEIDAEDLTMLDLHFHDLRHEATSRLAEHFGMHELMKITGHKTASMLNRYYHPRAEDLAKKLRAIER